MRLYGGVREQLMKHDALPASPGAATLDCGSNSSGLGAIDTIEVSIFISTKVTTFVNM